MAFETLIVERPETAPGVALIRLNRPEALNALNSVLLTELGQALAQAQGDDTVGCIVLTGSPKAFAAGADIKEMSDKSYADMFKADFFTAQARAIETVRKPIIAAVSGYALGGGCELAMMCDFILAADTAKFGQPEINLGVAPGIGGTQRLTRLVGKSKAMDMILTGRMMDAEEAERAGLVSRIFPADQLVDEAVKVAARIAAQSPLATAMNKELVNAAYETTLTTGVALERRLFHSLFAFDDQKEGMAAFVEKRKPAFKGS
ncbi:enoyl-CoA hydratase [Caulobacter endophyticus]|uniref:enoyl-CoA hydratase n=1 Tax=Caulobacter endophyticus TaxID=2172652 RepID=UPI00240FF8DC|nr:enoyl-CoA hydratase [Caulobacter endophyticus]MDG2529778.1 enoyl-CoA hydratase [Caulobacter endophyticus]